MSSSIQHIYFSI